MPIPFMPSNYGQAFITNTVVQGDGKSQQLAIEAFRCFGGVYVEGVLLMSHSLGSLMTQNVVILDPKDVAPDHGLQCRLHMIETMNG